MNSNGNGHQDETPEPPQSLFSWAEFMAEEPVKAQGPGPQASARHALDVRVGADCGSRSGHGHVCGFLAFQSLSRSRFTGGSPSPLGSCIEAARSA